jgi:hypothetical protein
MLRRTDKPDFELATDAASSVGFGCVFGSNWFWGAWPDKTWKSTNIAVLELYPIFVALHLWRSQFTDKVVRVLTDNQALVTVINRLYSRDAGLRRFLRPIADLCLGNNILMVASHIPGVENIGPDLISRGRIVEFRNRFPQANKSPEEIPISLRPSQL